MRNRCWTLSIACGLLAAALVPASGCRSISAADEKHLLDKGGPDNSHLELGERVALNVRTAFGYGPDENIARTLYQEGETLYQAGKPAEAVDKFKQAAQRWPDSALEEDALYMHAECWFFTDNYSKAFDGYQTLLKKYQNTRHIETVSSRLFVIGRYWEQQSKAYSNPIVPNITDPKRPLFDTFGNALACYQTIRLNDPTGPLADDSMMATATAFYSQGRFQDADYYYEQLRKEYPRSEHQPKAHLLAIESKFNSYQGPQYEGRGLDSAQKLAKSSMIQFPSELGEGRTRLVEVQDSVYVAKARREFEMGEYYLRGEHHRAARYYFQYVMENYPDCDYAVKARERLAEIQGRPDQAPNRLEWVARPFEPIGRKK